jgi:hypothetical protein
MIRENYPSETIEVSGEAVQWNPVVRTQRTGIADLSKQLAESTPAASDLLVWAADPKSQPPQAWFDDDDDPFTTESE